VGASTHPPRGPLSSLARGNRTGPSSYPFMKRARGSPARLEPVWGLSSAGRATESHSVGHRFDPDRLHHLRFAAMASPIDFGWRAFGATGSTSAFCGGAAKPARDGALAQLGERVLCKHEVTGSIPVGSTSSENRRQMAEARGTHLASGLRSLASERVGSSGG
jgi:hypothetical protein